MKFIQRFIALKMSILRVDAAIIKRKKVKRNGYPQELVDVGNGIRTGIYIDNGRKRWFCVEAFV